MEVLRPILSFGPKESALSCTARAAAFHTGGTVTPFLPDIGIAPMSLVAGEPEAIDKLCTTTGSDFDQVSANAAVRTGKRAYRLRGEALSAEFFVRPRVAFCPLCLHDDDASHPDPAVARRHRWFWALDVVKTCPQHGLPIVRLSKEHHEDELVQLGLRVKEQGAALAQLIDGQTTRPVSELQDYVINRLDGAVGPAWLDSQSIEQAQWATEMLGAVVAFGTGVSLDTLNEDDWHEAGRAGYAYTSKGEAVVQQALEQIFASFEYTAARPGPQKIFGPLYTSLSAKRAVKDRGPITDIMREFIFENFALSAGTKVLGEPLAERRRHTAASLASKAGLDTRLVQNALVTAGLLPNAKNAQHMTVDAETGRRIAEKIQRVIYLKELPTALNTTRNVAYQVVSDRILQPIAGRSAQSKGHTSKAVDRADVKKLLAQIEQLVPTVVATPAGHVPLIKAAEKAKTPTGSFMHLLLAGALTDTVRIEGEAGIAALRFDPAQIKTWVLKVDTVGLEPLEVAGKLRLPLEAVLKLCKDPSAPLKMKTITSSTDHQFARVPLRDVERFGSIYNSLAPILERLEIRRFELRRILKAKGIKPVFDWANFGTDIYRISDLRGIEPG
ncbi:TniQ family protein [Roseobacter denitrificans]|uniref:TniQ domain-containing protein n=2 Tax=Roseobacter denitrificans TaxID=2434 RepID=Q160V9_ROSDO|nr:TniQ family protein [Roseobacter denitrificans]ABG33484.1 hypothetical protein RD1_4039 [Roseobacter denitrificans OCh 114]SFG05345.1 TniQ protein [Roseobacter denitrificans OCh 114]